MLQKIKMLSQRAIDELKYLDLIDKILGGLVLSVTVMVVIYIVSSIMVYNECEELGGEMIKTGESFETVTIINGFPYRNSHDRKE